MTFTAPFEALDADTRDYLQAVRRRRGRGTPGVYAAAGDPLPWFALVLGPTFGLVLFALSFNSSKDAWATALLQTAAVLIGGWPVWFAARRWASGTSRWYGGRYTYFDPLTVYQVNGETVTVTSLAAVRGVEAGTRPGGGAVRFDLGDAARVVSVRTVAQAQRVEDYYAAMAELEGRPDGKWANADPAVLGAASRHFADTQEEPREVSDTGLELADVPRSPAVTARSGWGCGGLLLVLVAGAGLFAAFWAVNVPLGDDIAFNEAKQAGAPGLRGYLLDPRNSRHRDEARQLLAKAYDPPIARLKGLPAGVNPELRAGLIALLDALRASDSPVVSIRVTQEAGPGEPDTATQLRSELADGLARSIGPELIAFIAPPDDKPAHLGVKYKFLPPKDDGLPVAAVTLEVRTALDKPPTTGSWEVPLRVNPGLAGVQRADLLKQELSRELVGEWRPAPPRLGAGDF